MKVFHWAALCALAVGCGKDVPQEPTTQQPTTVTAEREATEPADASPDAATDENGTAGQNTDESSAEVTENETTVDASGFLQILTERERER